MRRFLCGFLLLILPGLAGAVAQSPAADAFIRDALAAEAKFNSKAALELFLQAEKAKPNDVFILQKIARQYSDSILDVPAGDSAEKRRLAQLALQYSERAVQLDPQNAVNVLSVAISYGKLALSSDTRTKIRYARLIKENAERALVLQPDYDFAHHVLGVWHAEMASIGGTSRFFASALYGSLPSGSLAEAIRHFQRAVALSPHTAVHHVELGFAYLANNQLAEARAAFNTGLALPVTDKNDEPAKARARAALAKLK